MTGFLFILQSLDPARATRDTFGSSRRRFPQIGLPWSSAGPRLPDLPQCVKILRFKMGIDPPSRLSRSPVITVYRVNDHIASCHSQFVKKKSPAHAALRRPVRGWARRRHFSVESCCLNSTQARVFPLPSSELPTSIFLGFITVSELPVCGLPRAEDPRLSCHSYVPSDHNGPACQAAVARPKLVEPQACAGGAGSLGGETA